MTERNNNWEADQQLVEKVLRGDTNAFSVIVHNTERLVLQIVFKMLPGNEDRKDITQDTYLKAFQKLNSFKFQAKLSTWIGQIAYNNCFNFLERKQLILLDNTEQFYGDENEVVETANGNIDLFSSEPERKMVQKELSEVLSIEIDRLSPVYKTLITLYHNEDLSYFEIGQITGLPEGTVKNYLFRARKQLKANLLFRYKKEAL